MSEQQFRIIAISGSLRKGSYNTMALKAAQQLAPANIIIEQENISGIPFYNADLHTLAFPDNVERLAARIKAADGVLFVSPEYNYSIPGALKNAIDILSRHPDKPFDNKAVAIMGASISALGTARMQYHLRQVMVYLNAYAVNRPEVMIAAAQHKFDGDGNLLDETAKKLIPQLLTALVELSRKLRSV
ncbi:MAG TPA: NAD(P)H-dependent oxidoreductase [Chitinophaga sp.]|uniref:NADPH-dependent FMN reductase n=1 Tax=Chitinophaga sp. TaxID=1869181 RepID=UPI002DBA27A9|nr:NAD(P)H-dependent oxidoreductase [Chitinophaga sp.]HEU4553138.1 NAD(P)H-dependent oxidoreductase [Chitinophaga sp.]